MDPLSIIAITGLLINIVSGSNRIVNAVLGAADTVNDPTYEATKAKLFTENSRLALWSSHVLEQGGWDVVLEHLGEEERKALLQFVKNAERLLVDAERRFEKANPAGKAGIRRINAAVLWGFRAQDDLQALIAAVNSINTALERVVAPPPGYYGSSHQPVSSSTRGQRQLGQTETFPLRSPELVQDPEASDPPVFQPRFRVIQHLHRHGLAAMEGIESYNDESLSLAPLSAKLKRWGAMLEGPLALDILLYANGTGELVYEDLREALITTLVDMILIEGTSSTSGR